MSSRPDILTPIHKGLQLLMFEAAVTVGRTEFTSPAETSVAEQAVRRCTALLLERAGHEDRWVKPALARLAPSLASTMTAEHAQLEEAADDVTAMFDRLRGTADADERLALGVGVRRRFDLLLAHHLRHMTWEEEDVNVALWAGLTDAELAGVVSHVVSEIGPAHMKDWNALVQAAANPHEREGHAKMP
jgi:hypothetical protein